MPAKKASTSPKQRGSPTKNTPTKKTPTKPQKSLASQQKLRSSTQSWDKEGWDKWYPVLIEFAKHGAIGNIPTHHHEGAEYNAWASGIRKNKAELSLDQVKRLDELQFDWEEAAGEPSEVPETPATSQRPLVSDDDDDNEALWHIRYQELVMFHEENGHFLVPRSNSLSSWILLQRLMHRENRMPAHRRELLEKIGFVFAVEGTDPQGHRREKQWESQYLKLAEYKKKFGTLKVSKSKYPELGNWLYYQKAQYTKGNMDPFRAEMLLSLGVGWDKDNGANGDDDAQSALARAQKRKRDEESSASPLGGGAKRKLLEQSAPLDEDTPEKNAKRRRVESGTKPAPDIHSRRVLPTKAAAAQEKPVIVSHSDVDTERRKAEVVKAEADAKVEAAIKAEEELKAAIKKAAAERKKAEAEAKKAETALKVAARNAEAERKAAEAAERRARAEKKVAEEEAKRVVEEEEAKRVAEEEEAKRRAEEEEAKRIAEEEKAKRIAEEEEAKRRAAEAAAKKAAEVAAKKAAEVAAKKAAEAAAKRRAAEAAAKKAAEAAAKRRAAETAAKKAKAEKEAAKIRLSANTKIARKTTAAASMQVDREVKPESKVVGANEAEKAINGKQLGPETKAEPGHVSLEMGQTSERSTGEKNIETKGLEDTKLEQKKSKQLQKLFRKMPSSQHEVAKNMMDTLSLAIDSLDSPRKNEASTIECAHKTFKQLCKEHKQSLTKRELKSIWSHVRKATGKIYKIKLKKSKKDSDSTE